MIFHETVIPNFVGAIFGAANNVSAEYFISNRCTSRTTLYKRGLRFIEILLHVSLSLSSIITKCIGAISVVIAGYEVLRPCLFKLAEGDSFMHFRIPGKLIKINLIHLEPSTVGAPILFVLLLFSVREVHAELHST